MEGKVCQHDKHGNCKFKDHCRKEHYSEICKNLGSCENIKVCNKRHPTSCRRFQINKFCQFRSTCAYFHSELTNQVNDMSTNELKRKLTNLENIMSGEVAQLKVTVKLLSNKIKVLETKLVDHSNTENDPEVEVVEKVSDVGNVENSKIHDGVKVFKCDQCESTFKKKKNLQKHINTKHLKKSEQCEHCKACFGSEKELKNHMKKKHRTEKCRKVNKLENNVVNEESEEYDSELDSDPKKCMECPQQFDDWSDLSDHLKDVHKL